MSLAYSRVSPTPHPADAAPFAQRLPEVALWSRYPDAPFVAVSDAQRGLLRRPQRRRDGPSRDRHRGVRVLARIRTTTCSSSAASRKAKGCLQAIDAARRVGDATRCLRRPRTSTTGTSWRRSSTSVTVVYVGEVDRAAAAPLLGAHARCCIRCRKASRLASCSRGRGVRHAGGGARSRRRARDRRRRGHGWRLRQPDALVDGLPRVLALDRRRGQGTGRGAVRRRSDGRCVRRRLPAAGLGSLGPGVMTRWLANGRVGLQRAAEMTCAPAGRDVSLLAVFAPRRRVARLRRAARVVRGAWRAGVAPLRHAR